MSREFSLELLAPVARVAFLGLDAVLRRDTPFLPFETYRDPEQQEMMFRRGTSKAHAFESAHQFGLAVDFVPFIDGNWRWDVDPSVWDLLDLQADAMGLQHPIAWDRAHICHPVWDRVRKATR